MMNEEIEHGIIFSRSNISVAVVGPIYDKWKQLGLEKLGYPMGEENTCLDGKGRFQHFISINEPVFCSIYFHPEIGVYLIQGSIRDKWYQLGGERGVLGYPASDTLSCIDGVGKYNHFRNIFNNGMKPYVDGSIFWRNDIGAFEVHGEIHAKWSGYGFEQGLGYPITDEMTCPDGVGRFNQFRGKDWARIYTHPNTGIHVVSGEIYAAWAKMGWERGPLGYPLTDVEQGPTADSLSCKFQNGKIVWSSQYGAIIE